MIDTLTNVVSQSADSLPIILGTTSVGGLVGKIVWDWLKNPRQTMCQSHHELAKDIEAVKLDIAVVKNDVGWIVQTIKQKNGVL